MHSNGRIFLSELGKTNFSADASNNAAPYFRMPQGPYTFSSWMVQLPFKDDNKSLGIDADKFYFLTDAIADFLATESLTCERNKTVHAT